MNAALELVEPEDNEPDNLRAPSLPEIPDDLDVLQAEKIVDVIKRTAGNLPPISRYALEAYAEFAKLLKVDAEKLDKIRLTRTKPLRDEVDAMNAGYNKVINEVRATMKGITETANRFLDEQRRIEVQEQARLNAEAEQKRITAEQDAERNRQAAEAARAVGNEKEAVKLENKANLKELQAQSVVPQQVQQTLGKVQTSDGGALSFSGGKDTWDVAGWTKDASGKRKPLPCTSPLLKSLIGDLSQLPEGVQFILRHADLNPVYLNSSFGREAFPKPFTVTRDYSSARRS